MRTAAFTMLLGSLFIVAPSGAHAQANPEWHRAIPGFRIAGNLYYVGTADLAVYLINTPDGNILINSDFKQDLPAIKRSIEGLGFRYADTKILLISHAHGDHDEGVGLIRSETGAKLMVMEADVPEVESTAPGRPGAKVDRVLHDRDTVELGGAKLVARLTPGHTRGCTTWTFQVSDGGRTLNAVIIGSPNVNPGYTLVNNASYPQIAADYVKTFALLKTLPVDLFLGAHGGYFNLAGKLAKLQAGGANPFIDPDGYKAYVAEREQAFEKELARQAAEAHAVDGVGFDLAWDHVALSVPNIAESIAWYERMLGFQEVRRGGQPGGQQTALIRRGAVNIELFQVPGAAPLPESRRNPSEDFRTHGVKHFGLEVRNLPGVLAELKAKGVKMAFDMRDSPTTAFAFISDNAGNAIELIEHKTPR